MSLGQQEQLGESSTWLGGKECHCLWRVLLRKILSTCGSHESSIHQVEPGRGPCPLPQTGNAKAAAGREELVSPRVAPWG